jgi:multidrug resistance efflux pump
MKSSETEEKKDSLENRRKSKTTKKILLYTLVGFLVLVLILYLIPASFKVAGYGNVLSANDAVLRAGSKGPIRKILLESGVRVTKDHLIIELEDDVERADVERCQRELDQARAEYKLLAENLDIEKQKEQYDTEIAHIQYLDSDNEYKNLNELMKQRAVSELELKKAQAKRDMDLVSWKERQISKTEIRLAQVEVQKRKIETCQAQLNSAKRILSRRQIHAPMSGVLVMHALSIGQVVDANEVLGQIFDDQYYQMIAHVPEEFAFFLREGQTAQIELSSYPWWNFGYFYGKVYWVSPVVNPQASGDGTILVKAKIEDVPKFTSLKAGMTGTIKIIAGKTSLLYKILGITTYDKRIITTTQPN